MPASDTETGARVFDVLRFALPWDAAVIVAGDEVEDIGRRRTAPLDRALSDADAVARLEALRGEGYEYLVFGASRFDWLDARPELSAHLDSRFRLVDRTAEACAVYALHGGGERTGADGMPLPPADLIRMTSGLYRRASDPDAIFRRYEKTGVESAGFIADLLARHGAGMDGFGSLLDFGCGCGRVVRRWASLPARVHGSDYNPHLAGWCADHLAFGKFVTNGVEPPLPYEDETFDFAYSISIFTHLDEPLQLPWMDELTRIVRPGGLILITVSGEVYGRRLPAWDQFSEAFGTGRLVVRRPERTGSNSCAAFHPVPYLHDTLTAGLEMIEHVQGVSEVGWQDAVLLRRPER
jgi:SAM-dependent methyltransferase